MITWCCQTSYFTTFVSSQLICIYIYTDNMCDQVCSYEIPVWCNETSVMMVWVNKSWLWGWKKKKYFHQLTAAETKQIVFILSAVTNNAWWEQCWISDTETFARPMISRVIIICQSNRMIQTRQTTFYQKNSPNYHPERETGTMFVETMLL